MKDVEKHIMKALIFGVSLQIDNSCYDGITTNLSVVFQVGIR